MGTPNVEPQTVLHIAPTAAWSAAAVNPDGNYTDPSLEAEGFIHCSTPEQVLIPANERFIGRSDLVLMVINLEQVPSSTVFEDCSDSGHKFPHIYGSIPIGAVTDVVPFPCLSDGSFQLPDTLR